MPGKGGKKTGKAKIKKVKTVPKPKVKKVKRY